MTDEIATSPAPRLPDAGTETQGHTLSERIPGRGRRKWRGPTAAELALLRWMASKPRPVSMGPVGHCVKKGWCVPVRSLVEDENGSRPGIVYVVTEAGRKLIEAQPPDDGPGVAP